MEFAGLTLTYMRERIVDECTKRGTCPMNRKEFDETFSGRDLTIQVRAALDFAQQNGLAFGRSMGDQHFVFSRLPAAPEGPSAQRSPSARNHPQRPGKRFRGRQKRRGQALR